MKDRYKLAHMRAAFIYAELSHCSKRKVGCILVRDDTIIAFGYNGTPAGEDNCCEDEFGNTKSNVIHAEDNALRKLKREFRSAEGASAFITKLPCIVCATKLYDNKIGEVYYCQHSNSNKNEGIIYLANRGIYTEQVSI